jgi:hypothetical protein
MKQFKPISFSKTQAKRELKDFWALLNDPARPELKERNDILPFFTAHEQLTGYSGWKTRKTLSRTCNDLAFMRSNTSAFLSWAETSS